MNTICLPLLITDRDEKQVFSNFYKNNPVSTDITRTQLAKIFREKTNFKTIFRNLLSMLKAYETKWEKILLLN